MVVENHRVPLVAIRLGIKAGSVLDPTDEPGLASAVASQMTAGTERRSSLELREAAERLGGTYSSTTGDDFVTLSASVLSENLDAMTAILSEIVRQPAFPAGELELYKSLTTQGLTLRRSDPDFLAQEQLAKAVYGDHPYGVIASTPVAIRALDSGKLGSFYRQHYTPDNAVLILVGDVKPAAAFSAVERALGSWSGKSAAQTVGLPSVARKRRIILVDRPGSVQSNIEVGSLAIRRNDPDFYALHLMNLILGGGYSSRVFMNVRETHGYAYAAYSSALMRNLAGSLSVSAQTRTDVTAAALKEMLKEMDRMRLEPVTDQELASAKALLNGLNIQRITTQEGIAARLLGIEMYNLPGDDLYRFRDRVNAVTVADIQRVAQKYAAPETAVIVVVGDAAQLREGLKATGTVEEVQ